MKLSSILCHHENTKLKTTTVGKLFLSAFYPEGEAEANGEKTGCELREELHCIYTPSKIDRHDVEIDDALLELVADTSC